MDTKSTIQKLIQLSVQKLNIIREKSRLIEAEKHLSENDPPAETDAMDQMRTVLEEKLLALDIEFLKLYGHVLEREGISRLSQIDTKTHASLADLQSTVHKIKALESHIEDAQTGVKALRRERQRTLKAKFF